MQKKYMNDKEFFEEFNLLCEIEKDYKKNELPKVKKFIIEFKNEFKDDQELKEARRLFVAGKIQCLEWLTRTLNEKIQKSFKADGGYFERWLYNQRLKNFEKQLKKCLFENRIKSVNKKDNITEEMIIQAREYPIEDLIEVNERGFAICPYHDDTKPSMLVRNGFAYCFSCNTSKDAIALVMDTEKLSFPQAVKKLCKIYD